MQSEYKLKIENLNICTLLSVPDLQSGTKARVGGWGREQREGERKKKREGGEEGRKGRREEETERQTQRARGSCICWQSPKAK